MQINFSAFFNRLEHSYFKPYIHPVAVMDFETPVQTPHRINALTAVFCLPLLSYFFFLITRRRSCSRSLSPEPFCFPHIPQQRQHFSSKLLKILTPYCNLKSREGQGANRHNSMALDNRYMLGHEIRKGAYGRVYKGLDLKNGDFVAIEQVSLDNIAQKDLNIIMQGIDLHKDLNHKNIVKHIGSFTTDSHLHIILEYVENDSLANIVKPNNFGPLPEQLVAFYIAQVLEGLVYLHEKGVIHRDIKGANIWTTKQGIVKLVDFGVAMKLTEADVNMHFVVGTPYWMAPEVIEMTGVCGASDIWSVGCTVIELLTGAPPYYDLQPMPVLFRIIQDENPPIPKNLSPGVTDFLHQCFKKDARLRPDAKTLLSHPWIQNSRRVVLQSS